MKNKIAFFFFFFTTYVFSQLPNTDIWLLDIKTEKDSIVLSNPVNITNRVGYDNQPAFSTDGKYILYTSIRDEKQSDIYKYDLSSKQISQFTNTPLTSEYSPTFMPDGKNISVVMVEPDSTQRLWSISIKSKKSKLLIPEVDSIGYHAWFYGDRIAVFLLTEPQSLCLISKKNPHPKYIDNNIGRCLKYHNGFLVYTKKTKEGNNQFYSFNLPGWHVKEFDTAIESEDYIFIEEKVLYGYKSKIFSATMYNNVKKEVANFSSFGITNITRIAISPDGTKLAIVAESK